MASALVIDDSRQAADSLCRLLSLLGVNAQPAYGPRMALLTLGDSVPDLVLLDLNLPGVSGFEVLAYLRREPRLSRVPVVMITSDDQPETRLKAQQSGALEMLVKPISLVALEKVLQRAKII